MSPIPRMIASRLALGALTLFLVSLIIFFSVELLPGDIARQVLGQAATPETVAAFRRELGLNDPAVVRYLSWLGGVATGDFGVSMTNRREIAGLIGGRFANTVFLAAYAAAIAVPLALGLGLLAALWRNSVFDRVVNVVTLSSISFPEYFVAYILMLFLAVRLTVFPSIADFGADPTFGEMLHRTFLPAVTLVLVVTAHMMRMTRASIINLLSAPYVEMARLKGASPRRVILRHALPNAVAPIANVVALNLAYLVTGVVIVEVVFVYPGLGQLMVDSVSKRDVSVVQACCLVFAGVYVVLNLAADILSIATNPQLLHPKGGA